MNMIRVEEKDGQESSSTFHLISRWHLARLAFRPWRMTRHILPKRRLTFNGLCSFISQKTALFNVKIDFREICYAWINWTMEIVGYLSTKMMRVTDEEIILLLLSLSWTPTCMGSTYLHCLRNCWTLFHCSRHFLLFIRSTRAGNINLPTDRTNIV
jgi:hypothetical protein